MCHWQKWIWALNSCNYKAGPIEFSVSFTIEKRKIKIQLDFVDSWTFWFQRCGSNISNHSLLCDYCPTSASFHLNFSIIKIWLGFFFVCVSSMDNTLERSRLLNAKMKLTKSPDGKKWLEFVHRLNAVRGKWQRNLGRSKCDRFCRKSSHTYTSKYLIDESNVERLPSNQSQSMVTLFSSTYPPQVQRTHYEFISFSPHSHQKCSHFFEIECHKKCMNDKILQDLTKSYRCYLNGSAMEIDDWACFLTSWCLAVFLHGRFFSTPSLSCSVSNVHVQASSLCQVDRRKRWRKWEREKKSLPKSNGILRSKVKVNIIRSR